MKQTEHYQLSQFESDDRIMKEDFNSDHAKIDAALRAHDTALSEALSSLNGEINRKADQDDMEEMQEIVGCIHTDLGIVGKNARMVLGSYTGTNTFGESTPNSLSFDFVPVVVLISSDTAYSKLGPSVLIRPFIQGKSQTDKKLTVSWGEKSVSWYTKETSGFVTANQNNSPDLYHYIAFGYDA